MNNKLTGKVAVVTGASKGIGASIAQHLAAEGAKVVVNYSSDWMGADKVVSAIKAGGGEAVAVQADLSKSENATILFASTIGAFGQLDILVNSAGIYEFLPLEAITPEHFRKQFNLNVLGVVMIIQEAVKHFGSAGGSIINISSVAGTSPPPSGSVYGATKASIDAITVSLSRELGARGIRVNAIAPGPVMTEGFQSGGYVGGDFEKGMIAQTPLGRIGQPDDIGPVAVFFASEDSAWITGETLLVSGGLR